MDEWMDKLKDKMDGGGKECEMKRRRNKGKTEFFNEGEIE